MQTDHYRLFPDHEPSIDALVHGFATHLKALKSENAKEATIRQNYIDPFWRALGWDVGDTSRVYDTTLKPIFNNPPRGLVREFALYYSSYAAQWDVLISNFGREAVAGNGRLATQARRAEL